MNNYLKKVLEQIGQRNSTEPEYLQAIHEVLTTIEPVIEANEIDYEKLAILERMTEPERVIMFRVPWVNDKGEVIVNRGYRIQFWFLL